MRLQTDTGIRVGPQHLVFVPGSRVPFQKVGEGDAVLAGDGEAVLARLNEVELVAVLGHAILDGLGRRVAQRRLRRRVARRRLRRRGTVAVAAPLDRWVLLGKS